MEVIVPAAGLSTRFPNLPPKYLLRDESGTMMLRKALHPYLKYPTTVGILQDHIDRYDAYNKLFEEFAFEIEIVTIPKVTKGPADTVYQIFNKKVSHDGPFLIKDCDSYFNHEIVHGNYICVSKVQNNEILFNLAGKSFVKTNDQGIITDIVEKEVVSDKFCVGGYKFDSIKQYEKTFESIKNDVNEIFVSHVIQKMLIDGEIFFENSVENYSDVGTIEEWKKYNESLTG